MRMSMTLTVLGLRCSGAWIFLMTIILVPSAFQRFKFILSWMVGWVLWVFLVSTDMEELLLSLRQLVAVVCPGRVGLAVMVKIKKV